MGYTSLDCFLCAFSSQADNSLSKKGELFVQLIFMFTLCTQISNRAKGSRKLLSTAGILLLFMEIFFFKPLDLKQNMKIYNNILLINSRKKESVLV